MTLLPSSFLLLSACLVVIVYLMYCRSLKNLNTANRIILVTFNAGKRQHAISVFTPKKSTRCVLSVCRTNMEEDAKDPVDTVTNIDDDKTTKRKKPRVSEGEEPEGMIPLHYTPVVWAKFQAYIGDPPPPRSFHTATAVPSHVRPHRRSATEEKEKGAESVEEDDDESEGPRVGCEQILIIGGRSEDQSLNDVFLLTLSDEGLSIRPRSID